MQNSETSKKEKKTLIQWFVEREGTEAPHYLFDTWENCFEEKPTEVVVTDTGVPFFFGEKCFNELIVAMKTKLQKNNR